MSTLQRNIDFGLLSEGLFNNFLKTKNAEKSIVLASNFLVFHISSKSDLQLVIFKQM